MLPRQKKGNKGVRVSHQFILSEKNLCTLGTMLSMFILIWSRDCGRWSRKWIVAPSLLLVWVLGYFIRVRLFVTPWSIAGQAPLSMGCSRQEYWSRFPFLPPWVLPHPPALADRFFTSSTTWEAHGTFTNIRLILIAEEGKVCIQVSE